MTVLLLLPVFDDVYSHVPDGLLCFGEVIKVPGDVDLLARTWPLIIAVTLRNAEPTLLEESRADDALPVDDIALGHVAVTARIASKEALQFLLTS
jgi:hypothetical protein